MTPLYPKYYTSTFDKSYNELYILRNFVKKYIFKKFILHISI